MKKDPHSTFFAFIEFRLKEQKEKENKRILIIFLSTFLLQQMQKVFLTEHKSSAKENRVFALFFF